MVKRLKKNEGNTLLIVIILLVFIAIMSVAIVGMLTVSVKLRSTKRAELEQKIVLSNEMYTILNDFQESFSINYPDFTIYPNTDYLLKVETVDTDYLLSLKTSDTNLVLTVRISITYADVDLLYDINQWGFVWV